MAGQGLVKDRVILEYIRSELEGVEIANVVDLSGCISMVFRGRLKYKPLQYMQLFAQGSATWGLNDVYFYKLNTDVQSLSLPPPQSPIPFSRSASHISKLRLKHSNNNVSGGLRLSQNYNKVNDLSQVVLGSNNSNSNDNDNNNDPGKVVNSNSNNNDNDNDVSQVVLGSNNSNSNDNGNGLSQANLNNNSVDLSQVNNKKRRNIPSVDVLGFGEPPFKKVRFVEHEVPCDDLIVFNPSLVPDLMSKAKAKGNEHLHLHFHCKFETFAGFAGDNDK